MIEHFHFLRPWWLLALLPLFALSWLLLNHRFDAASWRAVIDAKLLPFVLTASGEGQRRWPHGLMIVAATLGILALAGPTWEKLPQPVYQQRASLVILLDLSRSMNAADVKPSRLARARHKIADILQRRKQGQTALVVYAADAFTVTPLTADVDTILTLLPALESEIMPVQGTRVDRALALSFELLKNGGVAAGDILLISDGLSAREMERSMALLERQSAHRVSVLALGTVEGGPIPMRSGGFLENREGEIVVSALAEDLLRELAERGDGIYTAMRSDDLDVGRLTNQMESRFGDDASLADGSAEIWRELGPWLVLLALPFAALAFRRGMLWLLPVYLVILPPDADALEWRDLWRNSDQQAYRQLEQGEHGEAARRFNDPAWAASSHYRAGDYESALESWQRLDHEAAVYNRGNALAQMGRYQEALQEYASVLRQNPEHADARHNKERIEEWLRNQAPESQPEEQRQAGEQAQGEAQRSESGQAEEGQQSGDRQAWAESAPRADAQPLEDARDQTGPDQAPASLEEQMSAQATEQWLRKIPDDPGGLLRRKFLYQYRQRGGVDAEFQSW